MLSEDFYRILADGNINLSEKEKTKINKLYENMRKQEIMEKRKSRIAEEQR